ncbi:MAG: hypothetical protein ACXVWU_09565 [Nocardioides sp.]
MPLLLAGTTACSGGAQRPAAAPSPSTSTGSAATLQARPVPLVVRVTRVHGKLSAKDTTALEHNVGKVVRAYVEAAYLSGSYPRSDFSSSYGSFTSGVRDQARRDADLLTNRLLGPTTTSVTPKETTAYLSVLAPNKVAAGVTARVTVRYVADRGDKAAQQVTVTGRLALTRAAGGWKIFGYDLARSVRTVGEGS